VIGLRFTDVDFGVGPDIGGNLVAATAGQFVSVTGTYLLRINPNTAEVLISSSLATQEGATASPWTTIDNSLIGVIPTGGYVIAPYFINNDGIDAVQAFLTHFTIEVVD
jgi:hypothetical protein